MNEIFTVDIYLKRYVRQYLISYFGYPVNVYKKGNDSHLRMINRYLEKPSRERDKEITLKGYVLTKFVISKRSFIRDGCLMSKTGMIRINKAFESEIKSICREHIAASWAIGKPICESIREFLIKYGLSEDCMSFDLIYKDWLRNGIYHREKYRNIRENNLQFINKFLPEKSDPEK